MRIFRRYLAVKLFLSYLAIILISALVIGATITAVIPTAFMQHMGSSTGMMGGGNNDMMGNNNPMMGGVFTSFRDAVNEAVFIAVLVAFLVALAASILISRQVVAPIQRLTLASQRISEGQYDERLPLPAASQADYDELARLGQAFNRMAGQLEQTEDMRLRLIGDVSHELRTPLTAIKGSMEGLIDGVLPAEPQTFQQIFHEADRLSRLVDDLQELSRVEAGAYELNLQPVNVNEQIRLVSRRLENQFKEKGVQLILDLPVELPKAQADPDRLTQVLTNLMGNALHYTPESGSVSVSSSQQGDAIQVLVKDTGIGIPPQHLPHLFTRFYRVDKSRSRAGGGSGIGLTIAKHLVEAMGGKIWVKSAGVGQGSTFGFMLKRTGK